MSSLDVIWRWAALLLAEILNISASAAEMILRGQPRWVAHLRLMAENLRAGPFNGEAEAEETSGGDGTQSDAGTLRQILASYAILNRALRDIKGRGLGLDDGLVDRMKREWNAESIVAYLGSCDTRLTQAIDEALNEAAAALGSTELKPADIGDSAPSDAAARPPAGRKRARVQPTELAS